MISLFLICIFGYNGVFGEEYKTYQNYKVFEINGDVNGIDELIKTITERYEIPFIARHNDSKVEMLMAPEWIETLDTITDKKKLKQNIIVEDFSKIISEEKKELRSSNDFSWTAYYDIDGINNYLEMINRAHPNWTQVIVGGESYEGRKIQGLRINTPGNINKPVVFIESGIHAREWITPATTTYFINQLLTSDNPDITRLRDQFDWHIFPTVNPDGYHYSFTVDRMWRKTRSVSSARCYGADPNRNWDYNWLKHGASNNPCDYQTYGGSKPFSEIETRTLSNYIASLENLLAYVAFHADAQMLLLPYSDSTTHVDNYDDLVTIGATSLRHGFLVNGAKYRGPATAAEILYKASGGSMDWVRSALGTPLVYTYELRGTYFTWPANRIHEQGDEVAHMLLGLSDEARNLGYY
nr:M14 metal carboxypeptidase 7 [Antheraea yamamai]